jgi:ketosteroid isomerase-like protein
MDFEATLNKHLNAIQERNLGTLMRTLPENGDLILILPNGRMMRTVTEYINFHREWFDDQDWAVSTELVAKKEGADLSFATLNVEYKDVDADGKPIMMLLLLNLIFEKREGQWVLVHDQNTPVNTN